jgi:hypothetical protein
MNTTQLLTPILDGGIRSINFFNGRLLSGEDLTQERLANRIVSWRLGQAIGEGIAFGLEVNETVGVSTPAVPVLSVASGLAVNRQGQTLALTDRIDLTLVPPASGPPATTGIFATCLPPQGGTVITGAGVYLLVVSPASASEGRAPVSGLGNGVAACNTRYTVEGVQFRLVQLPLTLELLQAGSMLRNRVASLCLGVTDPQRITYFGDPLGPPAQTYGLLDQLRSSGALTSCDVPLAVVCWVAAAGVSFVDLWAVRRLLTQPCSSANWSALVGDRRRTEAEAMFLQFQDHVSDLLAGELNAGAVAVTDRFGYLPPVGLVPIADADSPRGFNRTIFFGAYASKDVALINGNLLHALLRESFSHEPIDLSAVGKIQLYLIWENLQAVLTGASSQLALVFASPTLPYRGGARFGYADWNLSRFAAAVI